MKCGDIIYYKYLTFADGIKDAKPKRPCVYLFSETRKDGEYIYSVPLTSQVRQFNKYPNEYVFISQPIYNYKKLSFANLTGYIILKKRGIIETGLSLNDNVVNNIIKRIEDLETNKIPKEELNRLKKLLLYVKLFDEIEFREKDDGSRVFKK